MVAIPEATASAIVKTFVNEAGLDAGHVAVVGLHQRIVNALKQAAAQATVESAAAERRACASLCQQRAAMWHRSLEGLGGAAPAFARQGAESRCKEAQVIADELAASAAGGEDGHAPPLTATDARRATEAHGLNTDSFHGDPYRARTG